MNRVRQRPGAPDRPGAANPQSSTAVWTTGDPFGKCGRAGATCGSAWKPGDGHSNGVVPSHPLSRDRSEGERVADAIGSIPRPGRSEPHYWAGGLTTLRTVAVPTRLEPSCA